MGRTITDLQNILDELMEIKHDVDVHLDSDLLRLIYEQVQEVTELIEQNRNPGRLAMAFLWTSTLDEDVKHINGRLAAVSRRLDRRIR